ncbi:MAG: ABC transporter permease [Thermoanaerobaculia bacterium]
MRRRYRGPWISLSALCVMLLLWEIAARLAWISPLFFPAPSSIARYMFSPTLASYLAASALTTLRRVSTGLACGIVPAALLGLLIGWSERLRRIVDPFLAALHPIPKIALFPLLIVIFGLGETPQIFAIAIGSFFPMALTAAAGARQINPTFFEVARNYGATPWQTFTKVVVPASVPAMVVGVRLSFNVALLIAISTEIAAQGTGLGTVLWFAWETFRIEQLYAGLVIVSAIGIGFNTMWSILVRRVLPWQPTN